VRDVLCLIKCEVEKNMILSDEGIIAISSSHKDYCYSYQQAHVIFVRCYKSLVPVSM
jgi:hypothetical protein